MVGQSSCFSQHDAEKIQKEIEDLRSLFGKDEELEMIGILNLLDKVAVFEPNENVNKYMKEAKKIILKCEHTHNSDLVKIICHMFVVCQGKQQLKDMLSSLLDGWKTASRLVEENLTRIISERMRDESLDDFSSNCNLIQAVQRCCLCQVGKATLSTMTENVFSFISRLLSIYLDKVTASPADEAVFNSTKYEHFLCDLLNCATSVRAKVIGLQEDCFEGESALELCRLSMRIVRCETLDGNLWNSAAMMYATLKINTKTSIYEQVRLLMTELEGYKTSMQFTMLHGILIVVSNVMPSNNSDCREIISLVFPKLHASIDKTASFGDQSQMARCLQQWSRLLVMDKKMRDNNKQQHDVSGDNFSVTQSVATSLLDYIVEHQSGTGGGLLYHVTRDLLHNLLAADVTIVADAPQPITGGDGRNSFLIQAVERCTRLMTSSASNSAPYLVMSCVLDAVTSSSPLSDVINEVCLRLQPHLLKAIDDVAMTTQASQLYRKCARNSKEARSGSVRESMVTWLRPILFVVSNNISYMVRLLFQIYGSAGVDYVTNTLLSPGNDDDVTDFDEDSRLRMLIVCLRAAQDLALYTHPVDDVTEPSRDRKEEDGGIGIGRLQVSIRSALVHQQDEIRIEALALLCESHKPSILVTSQQLWLLRDNVKYFVKTQSTSFRQQLVSILGKFFLRLEGNHRTRLRKRKDDDDRFARNYPADMYPQFIVWMLDFLLANLTPTASHARKMTSLAIMEALVAAAGKSPHFHRGCAAHITEEVIRDLKHLISDEYDDVRDLAFQVLSSPIFTDESNSVLWERAMELSWKSIDECSVKEASTPMLETWFRCPTNPEECHLSLDRLRFCMIFYRKKCHQSEYSDDDDGKRHFTYWFIEDLIRQIRQDIREVQASLLSAASRCPIYGLLSCARLCLRFVDPRRMTSRRWAPLLGDLLAVCLQVNALVASVVDNDSPEGYLPYDVIAEDGGGDDAQRLLVMCWRCSKEVANLLELIAVAVMSSGHLKDAMDEEFQLIGEHLRRQLLSARHRATFEINFNSFKSYVGLLWRNGDVIRCERWLMEVLKKFDCEREIEEICSTRRSAGLPFYLQAIVGGSRRSRQIDRLTEITFNKLTSMLVTTTTKSNFGELRKIHALNCLRALARDSSLSAQVLPHIDNCMVEAINGFSSSNWKIRNSSTLLMSALFYRMFGCNVERDLDSSAKNRISSGEFVKKFPKICAFFLETLRGLAENRLGAGDSKTTKVVAAADEAKLHPILLLLSRVFPSTNQQQISTQFLPLVTRLSDSPWYLTRVMCSKVVAALTTRERYTRDSASGNSAASWLLRVIRGLCGGGGVRTSSNRIHGSLLQMRQLAAKLLLQQQEDADPQVVDEKWIDDVITYIGQLSWLASSNVNRCGTTRSEFIRFFIEIHDLLMTSENSRTMVKKIALELMAASGPNHHESFGELVVFNHKRGHITSQFVAAVISALPSRDVTVAIFRDSERAADVVTSHCADDLMMKMARGADKLDAKLIGAIFDVWLHCLDGGAKWPEAESALEFSFATRREARVDDALLTSLLRFQARCFVIMTSQATEENEAAVAAKLLEWIHLLSGALDRLRYVADIRHEVALALRTCCRAAGFVERTFSGNSSPDSFIEITTTTTTTKSGSDDVTIALRGSDDVFVRAWRVALNLLADDDVRVRDVISDVCALAVKSGMRRRRHLVPELPSSISVLLTSDHVTDELALRASLRFLAVVSAARRKSTAGSGDVTTVVELMTTSDRDGARSNLFESKSNGDSSYFEASGFAIPSL